MTRSVRKLFRSLVYLIRYMLLAGLFFGACLGLHTFAPEIVQQRSEFPLALLGLSVLSFGAPAWLLRRRRRRPSRRARLPVSRSTARTGHEFEHLVARHLRRQGWKVMVTPGSGDQGIDIIATRHGRRVGIQCKRYSGSVGNKAVQEAYAGQAYHKTHMAVVITTGRYTASAHDLSRRTGVHLLHVTDIPRMHRIVSF